MFSCSERCRNFELGDWVFVVAAGMNEMHEYEKKNKLNLTNRRTKKLILNNCLNWQPRTRMNKNKWKPIRMFMLKSDTELNLHVSVNHLIVCMSVYLSWIGWVDRIII